MIETDINRKNPVFTKINLQRNLISEVDELDDIKTICTSDILQKKKFHETLFFSRNVLIDLGFLNCIIFRFNVCILGN